MYRNSNAPVALRRSAMRSLLAAIASVALAPGVASAQVRDSVWVNSRSNVYHCPGTEYYGKTARGAFMSESEARRLGNRPNGGRACHPVVGEPTPNPVQPGASLPEPSSPVGATVDCTLVRIMDGDTIECAALGAVRLIGMDSPEGDQEPFGTAATAALSAWLPLGAVVQLEQDAEERDQYRRQLAYVWHEGRMVNWLMVRYGWAVSYRYPPNVRYATTLESAESSARVQGRGLWRVNGFQCRPEDHRRRSC